MATLDRSNALDIRDQMRMRSKGNERHSPVHGTRRLQLLLLFHEAASHARHPDKERKGREGSAGEVLEARDAGGPAGWLTKIGFPFRFPAALPHPLLLHQISRGDNAVEQ